MLVVATHDVQLLTLLSPTTVGGEEHVRHVSWHGRQKFVPFGAVPGGHTAVHLPPFRVWVALAHVMQVSVPAPSHVAPDRAKGEQRISTDLQHARDPSSNGGQSQLAWQLVQTPPPLRNSPAGQAATHALPSRLVRSHG